MTLLFDGGPNGAGADVILPYLSDLDIDSLDYIVASHYHADHLGGLDEVFSRTGATGGVWDRGWSYTTVTYANYVATVGDARQTLAAGHVFDLGDGVTATCIALNGHDQIAPPHDDGPLENEYCVALLVECGDFDYFQAGDLIGTDAGGHVDIETSVAQTLTSEGIADLEVYKVNHHGSYTSSNAAFLNATTPEVAVISVGLDNSYGHPHQEPMQRLQDRDVFVYQTTAGNGWTLPPSDLRVVGGHVVIETTGFGTYTVDGDAWDMDEQGGTLVEDLPGAFVLLGNHPNPFNPATVIRFRSASGGPASLEVFDLLGRRQFSETFTAPAGEAARTWRGVDAHGRPLPGGVYLYRLSTPDGHGSGRMVLAK
jgi:beta-lactamase superfamily II metal-dependent hydrolase